MFYVKCANLEERGRFIAYLRSRGVSSVFHYVPLHSSPAGKLFGRFHGVDEHTTVESERLVRLPMYYRLSEEDRQRVIEAVLDFYA